MNNPVDWGVGRFERTAEKLFPAGQVLVDGAALRPGERCSTWDVALAMSPFLPQPPARRS